MRVLVFHPTDRGRSEMASTGKSSGESVTANARPVADFSVLLSVYDREVAAHLDSALQSVVDQTAPPSEIVLVHDGPLNAKLHSVIENHRHGPIPLVEVVLRQNQGLGGALSIGLGRCRYDLVARMDADDISKPERFEEQLRCFEADPSLAVVGSWVDEFLGRVDNVTGVRTTPETHEEIREFAKRRSPVNHPAAMYKKSAVDAAGGYQAFHLNEDYYLWVRMLANGAKFYNIQQSLLFFRTSTDVFRRRGGVRYARQDILMQRKMLHLGLVTPFEVLGNVLLRAPVRLLPNRIRALVYRYFLRTDPN